MPNLATDIRGEHLRVSLLDIDRFIKANNCKPITNPITFSRNNIPTSDGLLSNEIFGITMAERANTCAYIDLGDTFINPIVYKVWSKLDKKIIACVEGTKYFKINDNGELIESEDGECGINFLKKNFKNINIARTASVKRDLNVNFIEKCKNDKNTFIDKFLVSPAFYRDVDTDKEGKIAIGEINELYRNLIVACRALKESVDYGLEMSQSTRARIQRLLVTIFDWYGSGTRVGGIETSGNIPGKMGILRRNVMSKTTDYATRLVITAPELKYDDPDDMPVDLDHSAIPLASALTNFMPYIIFNMKRRFEEMFSGGKTIPIMDKNNKIYYGTPKDYQEQFSEDVIKKNLKRFLTGTYNRLFPVKVEFEDGNIRALRFKGFHMTLEEYEKGINRQEMQERDLTWCDLFYMAAVDVSQDKHAIIVRYPIDSVYNQFATNVKIASTNETEPLLVNGVFYPHYPRIRHKDIGSDTSHMFVDSLNLSNLYLDGMGGDYDGDTVTLKIAFTKEANEELDRVMNSNFNFIDVGGRGVRKATNESVQAMYNMTLVLPEDKNKLSKPKFNI